MTTRKKPRRPEVNLDPINWKNHVRAGSKFSKEAEHPMLNNDCEKLSTGINGTVLVKYDRDYVKAKISHTIFSRLGLGSYEDYEKLFKESWEFYQSGQYEMSR